MDYIGEHLLPGQLGHFFIVLSLITSLVATFAYTISTLIDSRTNISERFYKITRAFFSTLLVAGCAAFAKVLISLLLRHNDPPAQIYFQIGAFLFFFGILGLGFFYILKTAKSEDSILWKKLARYAFITEVISVVSIFSILFYIIYNHLFEYHYAWKHSSLSLEFKYLLACFWEGQEGSFMLWSFWHCVLGLILMRRR